MLMSDFQAFLNAKGQKLTVDGQGGPATRDAVKAAFVNTHAPAATDAEIAQIAQELGCTLNQIKAVANVESSGGGFDNNGRPKILFERHKFYSFTDGKYGVTSYSNPDAGGYSEDSWEKLTQALCKDIDAAFKSASWGKFQVMGFNAYGEGYTSALEAAWSTRESESNHYALFAGFIRMAHLEDELRQVSTNPDDCRPFAKGYNGSGYEAGGYHTKIASQMKALGG